MPDIRSLTLADRSLVTEYFHRYPPDISEHTFTNLFIWQPSRPIFFTEIDNSLVFLVKATDRERQYILYGPPERWRVLESRVICDTVASDHCALLSVLELVPVAH